MSGRSGSLRRFLAPGRANLIGEHTDHTDGLVLPAAIDRGVVLEARLGGPRLVLTSAQAPGEVRIRADGGDAPTTGWGRYVAAVAAELAEAGRAPVGLTGHLTSDLPLGAGLSSSAALEVVVAVALCAAADLELPPMDLAALCRRAEHRAVGVPSGIMDQAASLLGRRDSAVLLDCGTLTHHHVPLPRDQVLLLVDSGVSRELASSAYGRRVEELTGALGVLRGRRPADVDPAELPTLLDGLEALPARRLRHVVTENARVRDTEGALRAGELGRVGALWAESHASLRDDFEVSTDELDTLVALALEAGATAARLTGAGFGGAIVALVPEADATAIADEVVDRYAGLHPERVCTTLVCRAAAGARELV